MPKPIRASDSPGHSDWSRGEHMTNVSPPMLHAFTLRCPRCRVQSLLQYLGEIKAHKPFCDFLRTLGNLLHSSGERITSQNKWLSTILLSSQSLKLAVFPSYRSSSSPEQHWKSTQVLPRINFSPDHQPKCFPSESSFLFQRAILVEPNLLCHFACQVQGHLHQ